MPFVLVDYAPFYYTTVSGVPVPDAFSGKFVQIRNDATLFLVMSPKDFTKYHANIVERFSLDKGLEGNYDRERKRYDIRATVWTVAGGGKFEIDRDKKILRLFDDSMAYGKFETAGLRDAVSALPEFAGYTVLVE
jgi:hypothetical protein